MPPPTIQDVAREAKVSVATVSRVINNSLLVTDKTREIVLEAVNKLNYLPNLLGRNLRRTETKLILVLIPSIANPFYSRIVKGIEDVGHFNGYNIMLCSTDMQANRERAYLDLLKNRLADGIIFMAPVLSKEELTYIGLNFPVVQCCEYNEDANVSHITIDNFLAAYKATKHLTDLGHKRIGIISSENSFHSTSQREAGYKKAIEDSGASLEDELFVYGDYGFNSGLKAANQLLLLKDPPSAIFSISDIMAIGAIRAIRDKGLNIPEDVAVVGFDNISFSSMCNPALTTISQPKYDLGRIAMELLIKLIKGEHTEPQKINLETELIIREST